MYLEWFETTKVYTENVCGIAQVGNSDGRVGRASRCWAKQALDGNDNRFNVRTFSLVGSAK